MKDLLFVKRLHLSVFASKKNLILNDEEWNFEHGQVCSYIRQWVEDNVVNHIANETHARTLCSTPNGIVTMEYVKSGVLNEEVRRKTQGSLSSHSEGQSLKTAGEARVKVKGKMVEVKVGVSQGQSTRILNVTTVVKLGISRNIATNGKERINPENSKHEKNDDDKHNDQVAIVTSKDFFILYDDDVVNVASQETRWTVKMGNDGLAKVIGIGDMCLEMDDGSSLLLRDVKHILDIHLNLISIGRLDDKGYCNTFSDGQWKLTRGAIVVARGKKLSTLHILQSKTFQRHY
ncbi:hypothetical protein Patl1_07552 [Pistacia atlantica]|uniref:Uncharacterized protein n=1 Tax=Pistacia atlantica TaxID=434234 RepID=A0ACC1AG54_9ROSI|nr:hypothetical protein Patl1_07552 [Pistacia atlantica]